jgi:fructokinase
MSRVYGGIEAGGTKFVCVVGSGPDDVIAETRYLTTSSDQTIRQAIDFFQPYAAQGQLAAIGIASFGPVDLNPASPGYGTITTTPKSAWNQVDLYGAIHRAFNVPVAFDTDVNAAAFGEHYWISENRSLDPFLYITVGTGIGVGVLANGSPIHGLVHSEAGHFAIPHDWQKDRFPGVCPFHGDCLEGLASGPAIARRWGPSAEALPDDHPAWELEAHYIALGLANLIYAYSPQRIVLGGGVAQHLGLHDLVRIKVVEHLNGYIQSPLVLERISDYIVSPGLGNRSGVFGAIAMAIELDRRGGD